MPTCTLPPQALLPTLRRHQSPEWGFITKNECTLTHCNHSQSAAHLRFTLDVLHSVSLDELGKWFCFLIFHLFVAIMLFSP